MTRTCRQSGCERSAVGFSQWCAFHKARWRRHGAPDQKTVGKATIRESLQRVEARIKKNSDARIWQVCVSRWEAFAALAEQDHSRSIFRHVREAAAEIAALHDKVPPMQILTTTLAMYLLQAAHPQLIRSENSFRVQLVRRVRSLTDSNVIRRTSSLGDADKRTLKELSPRVALIIGSWLTELFGAVGVWLAQIEQQEHEKKALEYMTFRESLQEIK